MSDLRELYQEIILDHGKRPRNFRALARADRSAEGYNPLCGDKLTVYVKLADGVVEDVAFKGTGCAISTASASMMTKSVKGKTIAGVERLFEQFHQMIAGDSASPPSPELGDLAVFAGVREFPTRVKCATLSWHTLRAALKGERSGVSTE
jgi:nitrogen fixation NifU-like protein